MPQDQPPLPEILFDGFSVYRHLSEQAVKRTSYENVSDVLDAVVKALRASSPKGAALPEGVWQPLETRPLPPATYLVANDKGQVAPWINGIIHSNPGTERDWNYGESITHWMPLPQPPQESA